MNCCPFVSIDISCPALMPAGFDPMVVGPRSQLLRIFTSDGAAWVPAWMNVDGMESSKDVGESMFTSTSISSRWRGYLHVGEGIFMSATAFTSLAIAFMLSVTALTSYIPSSATSAFTSARAQLQIRFHQPTLYHQPQPHLCKIKSKPGIKPGILSSSLCNLIMLT